MSYLQTPKSHYNPSLTLDQLEEVTRPDHSAGKRGQSAFIACGLEQQSREQQEMDELSESWDWFSDILDRAQAQDYRPAAFSHAPIETAARTESSARTSTGRFVRWTRLATASAALVLVGVLAVQFWPASHSNPTLVQQNGALNGTKKGAADTPASLVSTVAEKAATPAASTTTDLPDSLFAWEEEDDFDNELTQLSNSFVNYNPGDNWSNSVACSYQMMDQSFESWQEDNSGF